MTATQGTADSPVVSVIIPTYNRDAYLREAVESVLRQTHRDWELIVVDDGSTDGSRAWLAGLSDHRVHVILSEHVGNPNAVRNLALARARGRYVAFLDSDDWWDAEKLARQVEALAANPDCAWSYSAFRGVDATGREVPLAEPEPFVPQGGWVLERFVSGQVRIHTSTVMADRELVEQVGRFDERYIITGDFDLWIRLAEQSPVAPVPHAMSAVRQHAGRYGLGFRGSRQVLWHAFALLAARLKTPRLRRRFARLCARGWVNVADMERHARRYSSAYACLASALPWGFTVAKWWTTAFKTVLYPFVPRKDPGSPQPR